MRDHDRTSQGWFARLCDGINPCRVWAHPRSASGAMPADALDERLWRDIGYEAPVLPDRRGDHYRRLLRRGYPLG